MADLTEIWTSDGGCFTVASDIEAIGLQLAGLQFDEWIVVTRVNWQDPAREGGPSEHWPLVEETQLRVRVGSITALAVAGPGAAQSLHRARAEALR